MQLSAGIGLIGCGTVGTAVALRLLSRQTALEERAGVRYELRGIAVRSLRRKRPAAVPQRLFVNDARALAADPAIDVLIECAGGDGEIADAVESALERGAHVVTANKSLIAAQGPRLHALAASCAGSLWFEAAVGGAVPIVRAIADSLAGDEVAALCGVVNGTTNAILCEMESGASYAQALADAQRRGFAEADPAADVEGADAAHKLAVLSQIAFRAGITSAQIARTGILHVGPRDIARARASGYRIRLLAAARAAANGLAAEVCPVLVPCDHPFAQARGPENAMIVVTRDAGALLLRGAGAGGAATASAVLGDVVAALRAIGERRIPNRRGAYARPVAVQSFFTRSAGAQYAVYPGDDALLLRRDRGAISA